MKTKKEMNIVAMEMMKFMGIEEEIMVKEIKEEVIINQIEVVEIEVEVEEEEEKEVLEEMMLTTDKEILRMVMVVMKVILKVHRHLFYQMIAENLKFYLKNFFLLCLTLQLNG